jgi:hypothetical protein
MKTGWRLACQAALMYRHTGQGKTGGPLRQRVVDSESEYPQIVTG